MRVAGSRRVGEGVGFVATWVLLGYLLQGNADLYLLLGIPLTIAFQVLVRRRPVRELWVRDATRFVLDRRGWVLALLLALTPAYFGTQALIEGDWSLTGWYAAAVAGAAAAAFAVRSSTVSAVVRSAALPLAVGVVGNVVVLGGAHLATGTSVDVVAMLGAALKSLALYFPLTFVIEEVAFRGALDAHVHHPGEIRGWSTALLVSALWGLWHLPVSSGLPFPVLVLSLVVWHCLVGVPLSFAWRRSGNLAGPALAHAGLDAVRNALMLGL
jgi:hypothetical protein